MAENERNLASGGMGGSMRDVRTRFSVDTSQMEKLVKGFSSVKKDIEWMHKHLDETIRKVNKLAAALGNVSTAQTTSTGVANPSNNSADAVSRAVERTQNLVSGNDTGTATQVSQMGVTGASFFKNFRGAIGGGAGGGGGGGLGGLGGLIGGFQGGQALGNTVQNLIGAPIRAIDARTDAGYGAALAADRLSVLYQQTQGITQNQYANQLRKPLQSGLLGVGGINTLLGLQAQTGLQAKTMMPGVEALRVASGFSLSTQDVSQLVRTLASPVVNNRLTMTLGTGIYGAGGAQRNPMQVAQQIVRGMGLTNERVVNSGMQQGSVTRARLTAMGVPEDMQDIVLQYAQENIQYQKRTGGKGGMYDPSSPAQRRLMGIQHNFATEKEVTDARRAERDERFYRRQADNYAALERNTQRLIDVFAALEDRLSSIIGARMSTRGNPVGKVFGKVAKNVAGLGMMIGGGLMAYGAGWTGVGAIGGLALMGAGSSFLGDGSPTEQKKNAGGVKVPVSYSGKRVPISDLEKVPSFSKLNPKFKERLIKMMNDNPNVGVGQGYRSAGDQRSMFLSRYTRTKEDTGTYWNGSFWKKNPNVADAAPPGLSMHEIGLAADLIGDLDWVQKNAHRYGLQTFANVNNEPWHVQPEELPRGRSEYEKNGAPWGSATGANKFDPEAIFNGVRGGGIVTDSGAGSIANSSKSLATFSQMSLSEQIAAAKAANRDLTTSMGGGGAIVSAMSVTESKSSTPTARAGMKTLRRNGVPYQIPDRKFTRADWDAIAQVETGKNWRFVNGSKVFRGGLAMHRDVWKFYGGREFAYWAEKATPEEQIAVAQRSSFDGYNDPKTGKFKPPAGIGGFQSVATNAIKWPNVTKTGDGGPMAMPTRSPRAIHVDGGSTITIAPNIYIQSAGNSTADAHRAAKETARLVVEETKIALMRGM